MGVLASQLWTEAVLKPAMEELDLWGGEPISDASSERENPRDADRERRGRGKTAELGLDVLAKVRGERVEQRDVRPDRRTAPREKFGPLGVEALLRAVVKLQRNDQRSLAVGGVTHLMSREP